MIFRCLLACFLVSGFAHAQSDDQWWFDVEVILFDRSVSLTELDEQFALSDNLRPVATELDVITDLLHPDISGLKQSLPICGIPHPLYLSEPPTLESILQSHQAWELRNQQGNSSHEETVQDVPSANPSGLTAAPYSDASSNDYFRQQNSQALPAVKPEPVDVSDQEIARLWLENALPPMPASPRVTAMQFCREETPWLSWEKGKWKWHRENNSIPYPDEIKIELSGSEKPHARFARILPESARELSKLSQQIRQTRGLNRLLHMTWRQQVRFGQNKAEKVRLFAGNDYAAQFTLTGDEINDDLDDSGSPTGRLADSSQNDVFNHLEQQLANPRPVPFASMMAAVKDNERKAKQGVTDKSAFAHIPIWKLDGYMKVYLKYINRVPYLHIESELLYRQPVPLNTEEQTDNPEYRLVSVPFQQMRRVISQQIHYFDHPLFGMIVQIRRHQLPMDDN
ncbi:CsiV family protein [Alteromonas ponticola]|uniref:Uncharacterized protein n=1 Tax=Alteromonas ponticola TaxID=2720613 RepID=A0ABX1QWY2_9ALTE|nr:CsiV family protein [Alteromonas ponticola]NMH58755.1 hypothetical protein [Alteromonas ponticola]